MKIQLREEEGAALAARLYPDVEDAGAVIARYPKRALPPGAAVTRIAPSPTGSMHIGGVYMALVSRFLAKRSGGVFFLRIEDTDKRREVEGAVATIVTTLDKMGLSPDEGPTADGGEKGSYGPYTQSARVAIYQSFAKILVETGWAYPCFATEEDLAAMRAAQEAAKAKIGYYGEWATWRDESLAAIEAALAEGKPWVLRLRSRGSGTEIMIPDLIRGEIRMPESDVDAVLLKKDGTPTYHLAHAVDDHLMGTTDVIRADEWVSSLPLHRELFGALGFPEPRYGHVAPIQKLDGGNRRKLSKRKDPEAGFGYYDAKGYPPRAIVEYLLNLANPSFEDWRKAHPAAPAEEFPLSLAAFNRSSPLFDEVKLADIAKNVVSEMRAEEVYAAALAWAREHDAAFGELLEKHAEIATAALQIERGGEKQRRDIACWSDVPNELAFFFDERFAGAERATLPTSTLSDEEVARLLDAAAATYDEGVSADEWFGRMKEIAVGFGLAPSLKEYKADKEKYRGHVGDATQVLRVALTGRTRAPDLYEVIRVLGAERFRARLSAFAGQFGAGK